MQNAQQQYSLRNASPTSHLYGRKKRQRAFEYIRASLGLIASGEILALLLIVLNRSALLESIAITLGFFAFFFFLISPLLFSGLGMLFGRMRVGSIMLSSTLILFLCALPPASNVLYHLLAPYFPWLSQEFLSPLLGYMSVIFFPTFVTSIFLLLVEVDARHHNVEE